MLKSDFIVPLLRRKLGMLESVDQVGMTIGNIVDLGNKLKITAWVTPFDPIGKTFDLLAHPAEQGIGALHDQHVAKTRGTSAKRGYSNQHARTAK